MMERVSMMDRFPLGFVGFDSLSFGRGSLGARARKGFLEYKGWFVDIHFLGFFSLF